MRSELGADIHVYIEKYNKESKRWEHLNLYKKNPDGTYEPILVYDGRNYELFGLLAGVRGSSHFFSDGYGYIIYPRGLPDNLSSYVQLEWEKGKDEDGRQWWHTPTWYDFCELETYTHLLMELNKMRKDKNKAINSLEEEIKCLKRQYEEGIEWSDDLFSEYEDDDYNGIDSLNGFMQCVQDILFAYNIYHINPNEIRVVMWFDN